MLGQLGRLLFALLIAIGLSFLFLPLISVFISMPPGQLLTALRTEEAYQALRLSMETTVITLCLTLLLGTPMAYWLAKQDFRGNKLLRVAVQLPIVSPPAVAGVGLLLVFGRMGLLGDTMEFLGISLSFNVAAVVLAQLFISFPFYVSSAIQAFESVDAQLSAVSRTLGVSRWKTFCRVTLPLASPGLLSGIALSWGRALGEFGATMMFAGNLPGKTQTLPLSIYTAMQSDMDAAIAMSALLLMVSFVLLLLVFLIGRTQRINRTGKKVGDNDAILPIEEKTA